MRKNVLRAKYRIVTPMFSSRNGENAELRIASIKGAMRFWWRTLMWSTTNDCEELLKKENRIFGSTDAQSLVRLRLLNKSLQNNERKNHQFEEGKLIGAHYLAYGVMEAFNSKKKQKKAGQINREMIPGGSFEIEVWLYGSNVKPKEIENIKEQLKKVLILLGTVGGIGSKSRKGYGSLTITGLYEDDDEVVIEPDVKQRIASVLGNLSSINPEWTAWSTNSRVILTRKAGETTSNQLLNSIGLEELYYRSWGKDGYVNGREREENFKFDHDLEKSPNSKHHPERVAFGLPHNYGKGRSHAVEPFNKELNRRASPLFIHIHQEKKESQPVGIVSFLPARFLPKDAAISSFGYRVPVADKNFIDFWRPVNDFLERLISPADSSKQFRKATNLIGEEVPLV